MVREAVRILERNREPFVVIEQDEQILEDKKYDDLLYIRADATRDEVLQEAGIERAKALISTLPDDTQCVCHTDCPQP